MSASSAIAQQSEFIDQLTELPGVVLLRDRSSAEEAREVLGGEMSVEAIQGFMARDAEVFVAPGVAIIVQPGREPIFMSFGPNGPEVGYWCRILPICDDRFR